MGVSIVMRPGTIMRSKGKPEDITPGFRSAAASVLRDMFGETPFEVNRDDLERLTWMRRACTVYTLDEPNFWGRIEQAVEAFDSVVIDFSY